MPREIVSISVGQTGLQIGWRFWDLLVREHARRHAATAAAGAPQYDECLSTFFRNWDAAAGRELRLGGAGGAVRLAGLRARAILVDTEEGVAHQLLRSPLGPLFDRAQVVTDVSGAGNNWAHGYCEYGPAKRGALMEAVRRSLEACDSPQSFFLMQSLGGGTGSGLGTYLMEQLADAHPELYRFTTALFPSATDDVVTSPYNFGLAVTRLAEAADCILPLENQALADVVGAIAAKRSGGGGGARAIVAPASSLDYCPPWSAAHGGVDRLQLGDSVWGGSGGGGGLLPGGGSGGGRAGVIANRSAAGGGGGAGSRRATAPSLASSMTSGPGRPAPGSSGGGSSRSSDAPISDELSRSLAAADALLAAAHRRLGGGVRDASAVGGSAASLKFSGVPQRTHVGGVGAARGAAALGRSSSSSSSKGGGGASMAGSHARRSSAHVDARVCDDDVDDDAAGATAVDEDEHPYDGAPAAVWAARRGASARRSGTSWDGMNNLAAHLLTHLTASMRFEGPLNVDLNEITTTLVPFRQLNMLQASLSPLFAVADVGVQGSPRATAAMFNDAFTRGHQLTRGDPRAAVHLACGLLLRGDVALSDVRANVERLRREGIVRLASWNPDGFKVGLCDEPPLHQPHSLLALSNNTSMAGPLAAGRDRFAHLWRVRAHVHHYTKFMEPALFEDALEALDALVCGYRDVAA